MNKKFITAAALAATMTANAQKSNKVKIVHNGKVIEVSKKAVPAHLAHGDQIYNAPAPPPAPTTAPAPPPTAAPPTYPTSAPAPAPTTAPPAYPAPAPAPTTAPPSYPPGY